ncbi:DoxX family protein [Desulforhopalus singaporensis]|uniref:Methylamine utilisation protein MauE n=1 Tax=Desulforhopalus singaporensis TaxID=91360 RepID=A0A1H0K238_9BACT|nr:MauE/DoxX family redox-associated membrane protein [Desulforhopalus singaporensis]SDO50047.1 Methylamine utilisation protein MauE [Desulforhopalus singaporensis]
MKDRAQEIIRLSECVGRWVIGCIFFYAGVSKLFDFGGFAEIIAAYGLLWEPLLLPVALMVSLGEIVLALGLFRGNIGCVAATFALLLFFIAILCYAIWAGLDIDCGCFGPEDPEREAFGSIRLSLARDIVMLLVVGFSLLYLPATRKKYITGER